MKVTGIRGGRRAVLRAAVLVGAAAVLAGCASGEAERRGREIAALRAQVDELRKAQEAAAGEIGRLAGELKAVDAQQAFLVGEAKAAAEERQRVRSALEQHERAISALRGSVEELAKKPPPPPPPAPAPSRPNHTQGTREITADKLFASAMANFRAEEHGQAVLEFTELIERFPKHPLAAAAQYWIGEAYYRQRDFRQALVEFEKVVDGYPQSPQVPEALLKMGLCFRALRDLARARATWERVAKDHPGTDAAAQARSLLVSLGSAGGRTR
jgi:tol-pal system protein YbgF